MFLYNNITKCGKKRVEKQPEHTKQQPVKYEKKVIYNEGVYWSDMKNVTNIVL